MTNDPSPEINQNASSFQAFLDGWLVRQEHYLDELLSAKQTSHESRDEDYLKELISRTLSHYQQYFDQKSKIASKDIFLVFSPTWFSSFERTLLWIAGFKPGMAYQLVKNSVDDMSEGQTRKMNMLINETRIEERVLNGELAKIHESVAAMPLVGIARVTGRSPSWSSLMEEREKKVIEDEEICNYKEAVTTLKSRLENVLTSADLLRTKTALKVVEILRPDQNVKFLAAAAELQLKVRTWGMQKDAERSQKYSG